MGKIKTSLQKYILADTFIHSFAVCRRLSAGRLGAVTGPLSSVPGGTRKEVFPKTWFRSRGCDSTFASCFCQSARSRPIVVSSLAALAAPSSPSLMHRQTSPALPEHSVGLVGVGLARLQHLVVADGFDSTDAAGHSAVHPTVAAATALVVVLVLVHVVCVTQRKP